MKKDQYLRLQPFVDPLSGKTVNGITWAAHGYVRGAESMQVNIAVLSMKEDGETVVTAEPIMNFNLDVPKDVIEGWGPDEVMDTYILSQREIFKLRETPPAE